MLVAIWVMRVWRRCDLTYARIEHTPFEGFLSHFLHRHFPVILYNTEWTENENWKKKQNKNNTVDLSRTPLHRARIPAADSVKWACAPSRDYNDGQTR